MKKTNLQVVQHTCEILDELITEKPNHIHSFAELINFVSDRPGHDRRYTIDATKIWQDLQWKPQETFESGLKKTVLWFLANKTWCENVQASLARARRGQA